MTRKWHNLEIITWGIYEIYLKALKKTMINLGWDRKYLKIWTKHILNNTNYYTTKLENHKIELIIWKCISHIHPHNMADIIKTAMYEFNVFTISLHWIRPPACNYALSGILICIMLHYDLNFWFFIHLFAKFILSIQTIL